MRLVGEGAGVDALWRNLDDLDALRAETDGEIVKLDLSKVDSTRAAAPGVKSVELLVNCAKSATAQPSLEIAVAAFDEATAAQARAARKSGPLSAYATDILAMERRDNLDPARRPRVIAAGHVARFSAEGVERANTPAADNNLAALMAAEGAF